MVRSFTLQLGTATWVSLLAALAIPLLGSWQIERTKEALLVVAGQSAQTLAHALAQHAERTMEGVDLVLSEVAERVERRVDAPDLEAYLQEHANWIRQSSGLAVVGPDGDVVADSRPAHSPINVADRPYFLWHRDHTGQALRIDDPVIGRADHALVIPISRRVDAKDGSFAGVVATALVPQHFQSFYDSLDIGSAGTITLYSAAGHILVRNPPAPGISGRDVSHAAGSASFLSQNAGVVRSLSPIDGTERIYAFEHVERYPLIVAAAIAVDDALRQWRRDSTTQVLVLGLASVILLVLGVVLERHRRFADRRERMLRDADRKYRLLAENSSDLITLKPNFAGRRVYVSPSSTAVVGWSPEELAVLPNESYVHPEDFERVEASFAGLSAAEPSRRIVYRVRHKDGRYIWIEAAIQTARSDAEDEGVVLVARDVTARIAAEEALRASERIARDSETRLRIVVENIPAMISDVDRDERYRFLNSKYCEWTGLPASDVLGRTIGEVHGRASHERLRPLLRSVFAGRPVGIDQAMEMSLGTRQIAFSMIPRFEDDGSVAGFLGFGYDVTQRYKAEIGLRESRNELKLLADNIPGLIAIVDADLRYRFVNRAYAEWFEIDPAGLVGMSLRDFYGDAVFADMAPDLGRVLRGDTITGERKVMAGGAMRHCHVVLIPRRDQTGATVGLFAIHTDITERKTAEIALRASRNFLERTGAVAGVGGWEVDLVGGGVTWSDQTCRLHDVEPGYRPTLEEALGFYTPASRPVIEQAVRDCLEQGLAWDLELELVSAAGRPFWARATGTAEFEDGKAVRLVGAFQDITALIHAQRQVREKSQNLQATLDHMEQGLLKVAADGTVELANRRYIELLELPADIFDGPRPKWQEVLAYLDRRGEFVRADSASLSRIRTAPLTNGSFERMRPDGRILDVRVAPLPDGSVVVTYADITARRHAERAVRESEIRYRMLAEATSDVITQLDLDLVHRYVSPACRSILGYEPEDVMGLKLSANIHPEDAPAVRSTLELLAAGAVQGDRATTTNRMRHTLGHWVWLEANVNLVRDPDTGAPKSLICSLRDVTERQRAARHLEKARATAEQAARLKAEFVANMSHELRTPLSGILGIHDLLRADPTLGPRQKHYLDLAQDAGRSLLTIVNDVLDFSKIEAGQLSIETIPFDLTRLIESCRDFCRAETTKPSLRFVAHVEGASGPLAGDPNRLRQILLNLLGNAVKFTENGCIGIDARYDPERGRLRIAVTDTGIGIAEDKLSTLFERFSQADTSITRSYGGTGLGLAICKRLVELMGGEIGVVSKPSQGSTFWFEVPLEQIGAATLVSPGDDDADMSRPLRILLAEDNLLNQEIIVAMIRHRGHAVTAVDTGAAAVAAARVGTFDVILLDVQMPVMDGLSAARSIRSAEAGERRRATPIIGLTANALVEDVARCRDAGMDGHVAKPIDWIELFATLDRLAGQTRGAGTQAMEAPAVLDEMKLKQLSSFIGGERLATMLDQFAMEVEHRLVDLVALTVPELATRSHSLLSLAGQLGFMELSQLCADIEKGARQGSGSNRLADLRAAGERAISAARSNAYRMTTDIRLPRPTFPQPKAWKSG